MTPEAALYEVFKKKIDDNVAVTVSPFYSTSINAGGMGAISDEKAQHLRIDCATGLFEPSSEEECKESELFFELQFYVKPLGLNLSDEDTAMAKAKVFARAGFDLLIENPTLTVDVLGVPTPQVEIAYAPVFIRGLSMFQGKRYGACFLRGLMNFTKEPNWNNL